MLGGMLLAVLVALVLIVAAVFFLVSPQLRRGSVTIVRRGSATVEGTAQRVEEAALPAALGGEELARLQAARIWVVEYRDEFSHDESPSSYERYDYPVAVCFSAKDAEAEASRRGERFKPGSAGFDFYGPVAPIGVFRDDGHPDNVLRRILERLSSGSKERISLRET